MRKAIEYYKGYEINEEVIKRINSIEQIRINEGLTSITPEPISTLEDLCSIHDTYPEEENVILGEDWYIIYTKINYEIEINEWLAIGNVQNKLTQIIEMLNALKIVLLKSGNTKVYATMRHSTSYKFYRSLLSRGYLEEISDIANIEDNLPEDLEQIKNNLKRKYKSLEEYLSNSNKENLENTDFDDFIYHFIIFKTTDKFKKRYKRIE